MNTRKIVMAQLAVEYDGTNGQELVDLVAPTIAIWGWSIELLSESNGEGQFRFDNSITVQTPTLHAGDWVQVSPFGGPYPVNFTVGVNGGLMAFLPEDTP